MLSRTFKLRAVCLAACVIFLRVLSAGAGGLPHSGVEAFLSGLNVSGSVREKLLAAVDNPSGEGDRAAIVRAEDGGLFCLALVPVPQDRDADVAAEMEVFSQNRALSLARGRLALTLGRGKVNRELYRYNEALGSALFTYYGPRGIETAADVLGDTESGRFTAALAWLLPQTVQALEGESLPPNVLDEDYCRSLYLDHAKGLFRAGQYSEALPLFKNIHDLKWMDISAYLDAAECFLKMGEPGECLTLVKELRAALDKEMNSGELSRAGRLCREAGDRKAALSAFQWARVRFHEEIAEE